MIFSTKKVNKGEEVVFNQEFYIRSVCPVRISDTYFFQKSISDQFYGWCNLTQISLIKMESPVQSYSDLMQNIFRKKTSSTFLTFFDQNQFWGKSKGDGMIEGNFYKNYNDFSTISNKVVIPSS